MATEWEMPRRGETCHACQTAFEYGSTFNAFLFETQAGYERRDYCLACTPPAAPQPLGSWRTHRPHPTTRKAAAFDREAVLAFFRRLSGSEQTGAIQFRFVLALLLWRKKVLKFECSQTADDQEIWRFTQALTRETYDVARPDLDEEEIERLSAQLESLLADAANEPDLSNVATPASDETHA